MVTSDKIPTKIIDLELSITLLEYLKDTSVIDNKMYNHVVNKFINKIDIEKNKISDSQDNYKLFI